MELRTRHQVAYELWCIHEKSRIDNRPLESIAVWFDRLRERHPGLAEPLIEQGLELFTKDLFRALEQRHVSRRRWLLVHNTTAEQ